jgi:hypothetical protein
VQGRSAGLILELTSIPPTMSGVWARGPLALLIKKKAAVAFCLPPLLKYQALSFYYWLSSEISAQ